MSTEKQIAANRLNALRSTGPRAAGGKAISSRDDAVRHDLLDKRFILASECRDAYDAFAAAFYDEYRPVTPTETALVGIIATARWRLIRMASSTALDRLNHPRGRRKRHKSRPINELGLKRGEK